MGSKAQLNRHVDKARPFVGAVEHKRFGKRADAGLKASAPKILVVILLDGECFVPRADSFEKGALPEGGGRRPRIVVGKKPFEIRRIEPVEREVRIARRAMKIRRLANHQIQRGVLFEQSDLPPDLVRMKQIVGVEKAEVIAASQFDSTIPSALRAALGLQPVVDQPWIGFGPTMASRFRVVGAAVIDHQTF